MKKPSTKALWLTAGISLGLHAIFFVAWTNTHENKTATIVAEQTNHNIDIQIVSQAETPPDIVPATKPRKPVTNKPFHKDIEQPVEKLAEKNFSAGQNTPTQKHEPAGDKTQILYNLLHTAINEHKYYPLSALRMQQQGKVRISFRLFNNGNLDEVEVSQSSGYHSLDNAALLAVKSIQPFHPAAEYIASVENFQLDIIFRL